MKSLIIVRGVPGSGKSTFAETLFEMAEMNEYIHVADISADMYFTDEFGNYNFDPSKLGAAHEFCKERTEFFLQEDFTHVIVHNTFTTEKEIKPYQELAEKYGYRFVSVIVENRHGSDSVHNVPKHTIERMKKRFSVKL